MPSSLAHVSLLRIWGCWPETPDSWVGSTDAAPRGAAGSEVQCLHRSLLLPKSHGAQRGPRCGRVSRPRNTELGETCPLSARDTTRVPSGLISANTALRYSPGRADRACILGIPSKNTPGTQDPWQIASPHNPPPRPHVFLAKLKFSHGSAIPSVTPISQTAEARTKSV